MMREISQFIGGRWTEPVTPATHIEVLDKFSEQIIGRVVVATPSEISAAAAAAEAVSEGEELRPSVRYVVLSTASRLLGSRAEEFADMLVREVGKTIREARSEVANAVEALINAAEESKRVNGQMIPLAGNAAPVDRLAFTLQMPAGPVCAITPFNSPLNIVAHKVGSAIAAGNPVVVKPSELAPFTTAQFADLMVEAGLPDGFLSVVFGGADVGMRLCHDSRFARYSFTGGHEAGLRIAAAVGLRPTTMELGPAGPTFVHKDADLSLAATRSVAAAFGIAGQVCTSVQRLYVHEDVITVFTEELIGRVESLRLGDPNLEETDVGPVVSEQAAQRAIDWIHEAVSAGARVLCGGGRAGRMVEPTVLVDTQPSMKVQHSEAFSPLLCIIPYQDLSEAVCIDNRISRGGLQAGIFTKELTIAFRFAKAIRAGGVMVNDTSRFRLASMPFGGVGHSGHGREGPAYAIQELTDAKTVIVNL